jgi:hypothetical protein
LSEGSERGSLVAFRWSDQLQREPGSEATSIGFRCNGLLVEARSKSKSHHFLEESKKTRHERRLPDTFGEFEEDSWLAYLIGGRRLGMCL